MIFCFVLRPLSGVFYHVGKKMKLFCEILATVSTILSELVSQKLFSGQSDSSKRIVKPKKRETGEKSEKNGAKLYPVLAKVGELWFVWLPHG